MHNPVTATPEPTARDVARPPTVPSREPVESRFAPLFSSAVELAITTVTDELGRPLVGAFVPDGELL